MRRKQQYHRTAALLGAQPRRAPTRTRPLRVPLRISWKVVVPTVLALLFLGWLVLGSGWYVSAARLHVSGASSTAVARDIALASELLECHGLFLRESATAELLMEDNAGLISASVDCQRFPAECTIYVEEREPVLTWIAESQMYWIDDEGVLFEAYELRGDLPQVRGELPRQREPKHFLPVLRGVEALVALGVPSNEFEYNPERGLVWTDSEGRRVAFGVGETMAPRWEVYLALSAHLEAKQIFPWAIDVRFPGGPTYSLERTW